MNERVKIGYMNEFPDFGAHGFDINEYNRRFHRANVIINAKAKSVSFPTHWGSLSLKCVLKGTEFYETSNALYGVDADNHLLFNEGRYYSSWIDSPSEVESLTLSISPHFEKCVVRSLLCSDLDQLDNPFGSNDDSFRFTEKLYTNDDAVTEVVKRIYQLSFSIEQNTTDIEILFFSLLEQLFLRQKATAVEIRSIKKLKSSTKIELFERLSRAKDYIYSTYEKELTLAEVADVACLNQYYFLRQFKSLFKVTPHQYLTKRRLNVASQMLQTSGRSVSEICCEVGFSDLASFSKLFKRSFGKSPIEYRKSL